jgi:copper transport protein
VSAHGNGSSAITALATLVRSGLAAVVVAVAVVGVIGATARPAGAHNTFVSSDPADGAQLTGAPSQVTLLFTGDVPLDSVSGELIDPTGARTDLAGWAHGVTGSNEVTAPLPVLGDGAHTIRWRLVAADGHVVSGRIEITIAATPVTTAAAPTVAADAAPTTAAPSTTTEPEAVTAATSDGGSWTTPSPIGWALRSGSYLGIATVGGLVAFGALVWPGAWAQPLVRSALRIGFVVALASAVLQLLTLAADVSGDAPWSAFGSIGDALELDAGRALAFRIVLLVVIGALIAMRPFPTTSAEWGLLGILVALLLWTWALAGHASSQRWSLLGVPLDVAHHAAAATWLAGLAVMTFVAIRTSSSEELVDRVGRFSQVAALSVAVIVGTGVVQSFRLLGSPAELFTSGHGRLLLFKLVLVAGMLAMANVNRQRVARRFGSAATTTRAAVENLRRAVRTELVTGLAVIGVTAALVVSQPAVAENATAEAESAATTTTTTTLDPVTSTTTAQTSPPATAAPTTAPPTTAAPCTVTELLGPGATGAEVECLQQALVANGATDLAVTGTYDDATGVAVRNVQAAEGLDIDGLVGAATAAALGIAPEG